MNRVLFGIAVVLACANRETGLCIPALFAAWVLCNARTRRNLTLAALYGFAGVATVIAVRVAQGSASTYWTLAKVIEANVVTYPYGFALPLLAFGAWWAYAWRCRHGRYAPLLAVAGLYMAALAVFGIWREARLTLPMLPILTLAIVSRKT